MKKKSQENQHTTSKIKLMNNIYKQYLDSNFNHLLFIPAKPLGTDTLLYHDNEECSSKVLYHQDSDPRAEDCQDTGPAACVRQFYILRANPFGRIQPTTYVFPYESRNYVVKRLEIGITDFYDKLLLIELPTKFI